jgi:hypothetical protein
MCVTYLTVDIANISHHMWNIWSYGTEPEYDHTLFVSDNVEAVAIVNT